MLLAILAVACILIIKETNAFDKDQWSVAKLIDVKDSPPYFLLSLVALWALRWSSFCSARLQCKEHSHGRAQSWCLAKRVKQTYRFYLLLAFFYGAYTDISETVAFARDNLLSSDKSTVNIVMDLSECLILKMATGSNADDAIKKFVLWTLYLCQLNFFLAHSGTPQGLMTTSQEATRKLFIVNGPIFTIWWYLVILYQCVFLMTAVVVIFLTVLIYCWVAIPLFAAFLWYGSWSNFLRGELRLKNTMLLRATRLCWTSKDTISRLWLRQVQILTLIILGIPQPCFDLWLDTNLQDHGNIWKYTWDWYVWDVWLLKHAKVSYSALRAFLLASLGLQFTCSFSLPVAIRLFNGHGFMPALLETISERHWYTHTHTMKLVLTAGVFCWSFCHVL